jgi:iron(III) transport system permease protein
VWGHLVTSVTQPVGSQVPWTSRALARAVGLLRDHTATVVIGLLLLLLVGVPLLFSIDLSFRDGTPVDRGGYTLQNYEQAFSNDRMAEAAFNTGIYAISVSVISLAGATFFAWLIERTDMPGRNLAWVLMLLPIAVPGMLSSMGWILLLSEDVGALNVIIRGAAGLVGIDIETGPLDIYSFAGLIFVEGLRGGTSLFIIMVAAFRLMDPSMEEAAIVSGASTSYMLRKITLRLMMPALFAAGMYALIGNLDDLDGPLIIGVPAGIFLLPTMIYYTTRGGALWGLVSAYTTLFLVMTLVLVLVYYAVVLKRSGRYATITGKAYRPRRLGLGRWRWPALGAFGGYFMFTAGFPILVLVWTSLLPGYEAPSLDAIGRMNLENYTDLWSRPGLPDSVFNTLQLGFLAATMAMIVAFLVSWLVVRQRVKGAAALDALAFLPHAVPTIAITIAIIAFYLSPIARWTSLYGTITLMAIAIATRTITFGSRTMNASMSQLGSDLEDAAYTSGVGKFNTLRRITLRLLAPAVIGGWIFVFAFAIRNLTIPLMLSTNQTGTLASTLYFYWNRDADFAAAASLGVCMVIGLGLLALIARRFLSSEFGAD